MIGKTLWTLDCCPGIDQDCPRIPNTYWNCVQRQNKLALTFQIYLHVPNSTQVFKPAFTLYIVIRNPNWRLMLNYQLERLTLDFAPLTINL